MNDRTDIPTLDILAREVGKIVGGGPADTTVGLTELGVDSLNIVELVVFCEQLYGAFDPDKLNFGAFTTLTDLDAQLRELTAAPSA
jgi:acyl carrier protein